MTDDFEERAHAAGQRVNDEAAALAGQSRDRRPGSVTSQRSHWLALAAALLVVAGTASLVLVASNRDAQAPANTASTTNTSPPPNASASTPESTTAVADTTTTIAPAPGAVPEDLPLVAFEESACQAQSIEWTEPDGPFIWKAFARGIPEGAPVQVIADPSEGAAGPFAIVLRDYEPTRTADTAEATEEATEIEGHQVFVSVYDALDGSGDIGNGQAVWNLPDGSQAYLRSRGLDRADIESIVANLRPRPSDHPTPGFDYDTSETQPARLTLVAEQTTDTLSSARYSITCQATNGLDVRVAVIADEGVAPYALAIDRHRPAWIVRADGAIFIGGIEARNAHGSPDPPADALTTISPERWQQLRQQQDMGPPIQSGGESAAPVTIPCHKVGSAGEVADAQLDNLSAEIAILDDGSVGIVVTDSATAQQWVGRCMSEDTAEYSSANGLSLAYAAPVRGGVFVAVAVPGGRDLVLPDSVIRSRSTNPTTPSGFDLVVLDAERVAALTDLELSAAQLQGLIALASQDRTTSVAGLGADLLETT